MFAVRVWPALAFACAVVLGCKPDGESTPPTVPSTQARVDLIPSAATFVASIDVAAFSSQGYRDVLPWLDDPGQPEKVSELRGCYTSQVETVAFGAIVKRRIESMPFAVVLTGPDIGAASVVTCFREGSEQRLEVWSEDAHTLVLSSKSWAQDVRAKMPRTADSPLSAVLEHVDTNAHVWFAVRLPSSVDEQLRAGAHWLSEMVARSTDDVVTPEPTATPSRDGIGYVAGSMTLNSEELEGRVITTFETRESVDLAHAVLDIGFVLIKHLGASPSTAGEHFAHELALHTTIVRDGDRIEARTRMSSEVLADAAKQAHESFNVQKMLGLSGEGHDGETQANANADTSDFEQDEQGLSAAAESENASPKHTAREQLDPVHIDDAMAEPDDADGKQWTRESVRALVATAKTAEDREAIYATICTKVGKSLKTIDTDNEKIRTWIRQCPEQMNAMYQADPARFEDAARCVLLHDNQWMLIQCLRRESPAPRQPE